MKEYIRQNIQKLPFAEKLLIYMIFFYGLFVPFEARYQTGIPVKPVFIILGSALMINAFYFSDFSRQIKCIIGLSFIGMELLLFAIPLLLIPQILLKAINSKNVFRFNKWSVVMLFFFCFDMGLLAITSYFDFSFYTILFWFMIFGFGFLLFIHYAEKAYEKFEAENIFDFFRKLIFLQLFILPLQSVFHREFKPGDYWNGSFIDADKVSFYILLLLLLEFAPPLFVKATSFAKLLSINKLFFLFAIITALVLCDAKIKVGIIFLSLFLFAVFFLLNKLFATAKIISFNKTLVFSIIFIFSSGILIGMANIYLQHLSGKKTTVGTTFLKYTTRPPDAESASHGINSKYLVYKKVYVDLYNDDFLKWLLGVGPGKFGSRTSNMLAYDIYYKEKGQFKLPEYIQPYASYEVKKYMTGMWTEKKANFVKWMSSNLSIPFAGWITIKAERGIPGLILYLLLPFILAFYLVKKAYLLSDLLRGWAIVLAIFWISLPLQMVIDNIQEKPQIMFPMYVLTAMLLGIALPAAVKKEVQQ